MGKKINPICHRLCIKNNWLCKSNVFSYKTIKIFDCLNFFIEKNIGKFSFNKIYIELLLRSVIVTIYTTKPGFVIGKKGFNILRIKNYIKKNFNFRSYINVKECYIFDNDTSYLFKNLFNKILRRENYKFFIRNYFKKLSSNVIGIKVIISGRINGSDIAKKETYKKGSIPLQTYKSKIIFKNEDFVTKYGKIGIKIWLNFK